MNVSALHCLWRLLQSRNCDLEIGWRWVVRLRTPMITSLGRRNGQLLCISSVSRTRMVNVVVPSLMSRGECGGFQFDVTAGVSFRLSRFGLKLHSHRIPEQTKKQNHCFVQYHEDSSFLTHFNPLLLHGALRHENIVGDVMHTLDLGVAAYTAGAVFAFLIACDAFGSGCTREDRL